MDLLKRWLGCILALLCLLTGSGTFAGAAESPDAVQTAAQGSPGSLSSLSAVLYEPESGRVLFEKDAHTPRPMASTTKLMTALLAAENADPEQNVVVTEEAVRVEGSALGLRAGDNISMGDLVTGLLLESGNDAANVIAITLAGSLPAFADLMNQKAAELGMEHSVFVTPSGLDQGDHSACAYDMALLGAEVMRHPELAAICATKQTVIEMGNPKRKVTVTNHNRLLSLYEPAVGMKTGFTKKSGKCLVSAAEKDGVRLIAVTLNGGDYWNDHIKLYEYGFGQVEKTALERPELPQVPVAGGMAGQVEVQMDAPPDVTLLKGEAAQVVRTVELEPFVWAPVAQGQILGWVEYRVGDRELCRLPVTAVYGVDARPVADYGGQVKRSFCELLRELLF